MTLTPSTPFIVGIDLGTTNSAVSYADLRNGVPPASAIQSFAIPQLTGPGEISSLSVLPSFLYIPGSYDISERSLTHPWQKPEDHFAGTFARDQGARVPARLVASAKSWLCHDGADREGRILPWGAGAEVAKVSPVEATAAYLEHLRKAWNRSWGEEDEYYLENQRVVVTVPASFDEVARDLTVTAAAKAGLGEITLIEEPLAAFYAWLIRHENDWQDHVGPGELILVCDVGGGTTDFTLICLREVDGRPRFERIAVGDHLILGGDNVDLELAKGVEARLRKEGRNVAEDRWRDLSHQCRRIKETVLAGTAEAGRISLVGRGSRLIAGTVTADLNRKEVENTVLETFFPLVAPHDDRTPPKAVAEAVNEFGLPREADPAVTHHLVRFLHRHRDEVRRHLGRESVFPDHILFNGGSLKPVLIQERIRQSLAQGFEQKDADRPRILENPNPDVAVAQGAAYFGLVKTGHGVRVGSGSARSFYLGVADSPDGSPSSPHRAICLVERGQEEGTPVDLRDKRFEVLANQPVSFDLYSSSYRSGDRSGEIVAVDDSLTPLPPVRTVIQYGKAGEQKRVPVQVEGAFTEMGTLALWCASTISPHRWRLQFQLRGRTAPLEVEETAVLDADTVTAAQNTVRDAFGAGGSEALEKLARTLARRVDQPRDHWPLGLLRALADELLELRSSRRSDPSHEARWLNFLGFCLRPGFGDGFDAHRAQTLWKIFPPGPVHAGQPQVRTEWWILWRRVAAGLRPGQQRQIAQGLSPVLLPGKGEKSKVPSQERLEMWMAVSNLELLQPADKVRWGRGLLSEIHPKRSKPQHLWALSRMGARLLLYGSSDRVVPAKEAARWCEALMARNWRNPVPAASAVARMARKTGDRTRDLPAEALERIRQWLTAQERTAHLGELVERVVPLDEREAGAVFGEALPAGLVLKS